MTLTSRYLIVKSALIGALVLVVVSFAHDSYGLTPLGPQLKLGGSGLSSQRISLHPFKIEKKAQSLRGLLLLQSHAISTDDAVEMTLRDALVDSKFGIRSVSEGVKSLTGRLTKEYQFFVNNFPVCGFTVKSYEVPGKMPIMLGTAPKFDPGYTEFSKADFPGVTEILALVATEMSLELSEVSPSVVSRCLQTINGELQPALKVTMAVAGLPYTVLASGDEIFSLQKDFFSIAGKVDAYDKNPIDGKISTFTIELKGNSFLDTANFTTTTGQIPRAESKTNTFNFTTADEEFAELNGFVHAVEMYQWFKGLGYEWTTEQLTVRMRENIPTSPGDTTGSPNNALYVPAGLDGKSGPMIAVADGDGQILRDLPFDSDVVAHEFGHHVIFRTLKSTVQKENEAGTDLPLNHSASLHEGLADFFAFAQTGDSCLAESICPADTPACWVMTAQETCLRSGSTTLMYDTSEYWDLGAAVHLKGQVVSGAMWDIREFASVDDNDFTKLAFGSLEYLQPASSYADWIIALMSADAELFEGKYGCDIVKGLDARGFGVFTKAEVTDCAKFSAVDKNSGDPDSTAEPTGSKENTSGESAGSIEGAGSAGSQPTTRRTQTSGSGGICGTIAVRSQPKALGLMFLIILFSLPVFLAGPQPAYQRFRSRRKKMHRD